MYSTCNDHLLVVVNHELMDFNFFGSALPGSYFRWVAQEEVRFARMLPVAVLRSWFSLFSTAWWFLLWWCSARSAVGAIPPQRRVYMPQKKVLKHCRKWLRQNGAEMSWTFHVCLLLCSAEPAEHSWLSAKEQCDRCRCGSLVAQRMSSNAQCDIANNRYMWSWLLQ